jgi:hypothetical protein
VPQVIDTCTLHVTLSRGNKPHVAFPYKGSEESDPPTILKGPYKGSPGGA